ncbi:hypothetical protein [Altererythrobacter sp. GH1-8]|uniref:hypothetical protein n=1 Tax=Altererythrobacter sp. GH1-8 TaxID=3349333 RepID=UPI00374D3A8B
MTAKSKVTPQDKVHPSLAADALKPDIRHGSTIATMLGPEKTEKERGELSTIELGLSLKEIDDRAAAGDLEFASRILTSQAVTLDTIFTEMARRMARNCDSYLGAMETYARLAMKAQSQSRSTLEALAKLHQPREQTVRHVHVNEGGRAIIADQFNNHTGGQRNEETAEQPHATGTCKASTSTALPCSDAGGNGVPIASSEGQETVSDARRQGQRRSKGQS